MQVQVERAEQVALAVEPAVGFAMGLERLLLLMEAVAPITDVPACDVFVVAHPEVYSAGMGYAQALRYSRSDIRVKMASATSLKAQMKKADKSGAALTVIIAQQELDDNTISIKDSACMILNTYNFRFVFAK